MPLPDVPEQRLDYVTRRVFKGSLKALATACNVSRSAVNKWPPRAEELLDQHLARAIDHQIHYAEERLQMLQDFQSHLRDRLRRHREIRRSDEAR
ncbi:hypothetical protein [Bradyrhizobium sp. S69]|uniref:hypothetical protein n=1 Tax=Bradyrhizobium sp. S69 TaxID=1641856 RepID=UPI00131AEDB4|nr:hypothetical protein [Bradyrhizobium sp. S69]